MHCIIEMLDSANTSLTTTAANPWCRFNHQVFAILGDIFQDRATNAFAFNFIVKASSQALAFVYSLYLEVEWQLVIVGVTLLAGKSTVPQAIFFPGYSSTRYGVGLLSRRPQGVRRVARLPT